MERWESLCRQSRDGVLMQDGDLGELYSYLKLFQKTYCTCELEVGKLLQAVRDLYILQTGTGNVEEALNGLRNPRHAGRKQAITEDQRRTVRELHGSGMAIREIAAGTGLSRSSVQRILHGGLSHN